MITQNAEKFLTPDLTGVLPPDDTFPVHEDAVGQHTRNVAISIAGLHHITRSNQDRVTDAISLYTVSDSLDIVFTSNFLEHLPDNYRRVLELRVLISSVLP